MKPSSIYAVPLTTRSEVIGILATDASYEVGVPKETREILEIFSHQIAIAIEHARVYSKLQGKVGELKRSQVLLSRVEKFSFLGHLSARLAHEIKNSMTAIGTFLQMLPRKFNDEEFRNAFHKVAMDATTRVNNLTAELLDLVKTRESRVELNDLHDLIEKMILLVSPLSNAKGISMIRHFDPDIPHMLFDAEKMKQVILNILSNAIESTPEGGEIHVQTRNAVNSGKSGPVFIEIKDSGTGIPSSMIEKIFDPYFTTKQKSSIHSGTGLGLFIAHKNMEDHKGSIKVESRLNEGTKFILTLPVDQPSFFPNEHADELNEK
jgi:signal transduction histidine kinase